jgi:DNA-binding NarL/FixJ family response regulator
MLAAPIMKRQNSPNTGTGSVRILVADDHEVMRLGIRNLLEAKRNWQVCAEAGTGQEAIDKARLCNPDVVIMDITMPVMNGLDAAQFLMQSQPQIPIVLFSLHLSPELIGTFAQSGIRGAVCKSDAARDLVDAVETVLAGKTFFPVNSAV